MILIFEPLLHYLALTCSQRSPDLTQTSANHVPDSILATEQESHMHELCNVPGICFSPDACHELCAALVAS